MNEKCLNVFFNDNRIWLRLRNFSRKLLACIVGAKSCVRLKIVLEFICESFFDLFLCLQIELCERNDFL